MKRVLIITNEASGDLHAANLIKATQRIDPKVKFFGVGGTHMRAAGADILVDIQQLAVMGILEILRHLAVFRRILKQLRTLLATDSPDLLILVDAPEFNFRLLKAAKKNQVKVLYFISPQLWAWRRGRIKTIQRYVDHMAVILPFELKFYQHYQVPASYVGNPLIEAVKPDLTVEETRKKFNLSTHKIVIGILPGSRKNEIKNMFTMMLNAAELLNQRYQDIQFIVPLAPTLTEAQLQPYIKEHNLNLNIVPQNTYNVIQLCNAVITCSGTATLEIALLGKPMVIIYKMSTLNALVAAVLIHVKYIGLCNIVAEEQLAKELIQFKATPKTIAAEISKILEDQPYRQTIQQKTTQLATKLTTGTPRTDVGELVWKLLS